MRLSQALQVCSRASVHCSLAVFNSSSHRWCGGSEDRSPKSGIAYKTVGALRAQVCQTGLNVTIDSPDVKTHPPSPQLANATQPCHVIHQLGDSGRPLYRRGSPCWCAILLDRRRHSVLTGSAQARSRSDLGQGIWQPAARISSAAPVSNLGATWPFLHGASDPNLHWASSERECRGTWRLFSGVSDRRFPMTKRWLYVSRLLAPCPWLL